MKTFIGRLTRPRLEHAVVEVKAKTQEEAQQKIEALLKAENESWQGSSMLSQLDWEPSSEPGDVALLDVEAE